MSKVSYVLVGFGGIAENRVAKEGYACDKKRFKALKSAVLVGATDVNPARKEAAEALGLKWYDSFDAVLADKSVDGVYIASNNATHASLSIKALKAGKHVIVEKPIATTIADAKAMNKIAKTKKLSLSVDHMMVNNAWNIAAKNAMAKGKLGKVNDSCFHMEFAYGYDPTEAATWRCSNPAELGGPIGDIGSHCFYMAEYMLGSRIEKVAAVYYPKLMPIAVEDGCFIRFTMANGFSGTIRVAFSEKRPGMAGTAAGCGYEIYGENAVLYAKAALGQLSGHPDEALKITLEIDDGTERRQFRPGEIRNMYSSLIRTHAASILAGTPLNAEKALHNLQCCIAARYSADNGGTEVPVDTVADR